MIIKVSELAPDGSHFNGAEPSEIMALERDRFVRAISEVRYSLFAIAVSGRLLVSGRVSVRLRAQCSRCAEYFSFLVSEPSFLRTYVLRPGLEEVDVTGDLREALVLRIPIYPLCREGCRGLCPGCGANLNREECTCERSALGQSAGHWDMLDKLIR